MYEKKEQKTLEIRAHKHEQPKRKSGNGKTHKKTPTFATENHRNYVYS